MTKWTFLPGTPPKKSLEKEYENAKHCLLALIMGEV
jgi:hypothetical protein